MKKKRWIILVVILCILGGCLSFFVYQNQLKERRMIEKKEREIEKREKIKSHYGSHVVTTGCDIYSKKGKDYEKIGHVSKGEKLTLAPVTDFSKPYFLVQDFNFYIPYSCVSKSNEERVVDTRYQRYIPFAEKIKTTSDVGLYRNGSLVYKMSSLPELSVIKKSDASYYVEYFKELFEIKKEDVLEVLKTEDASSFATEVPVTAYHFIYPEGDTSCTGVICHPVSQIRSHFEYLNEHDYFTITTSEMEAFLDGNLHLPEKSILITIDDGDRAENIIPLLEEFKINATLFLITAWYFPENYRSSYLELASHTHELHEPGKCSGGQGSALKCLEKEKIVADLKQSRAVLNDTLAFCYPLYEYNDHAVSAVKEAGFHLGFIGGMRKAKANSPKLLIPRITIHRSTTLDEYIQFIN